MREFFRGWRRRTGCVLLLMASILCGAWMRSHTTIDTAQMIIFGRCFEAGSFPGHFILTSWPQPWPAQFEWESTPAHDFDPDELAGTLANYRNLMPGFTELDIHYWSLALPLTLVSAYLILWPGKRPQRQIREMIEQSARF